MKLNKLKIIILVTVFAFSFGACSSSNNSGDASTNQSAVNIAIPACEASSTADNIATYVATINGDDIVKDEANSTITLFMDADDVKKVCLESGKAHIERK